MNEHLRPENEAGRPKIGDRIYERRDTLGLTLEDIAVELGVNRSTVKRYESGETTRIPLNRIRQLAGILKTTPEYLLGLDDRQDEIPAFDEDVIVMARVLQSVPPEKRELFSRMLQMMAGDPTDTKGLKARGIPAQTED